MAQPARKLDPYDSEDQESFYQSKDSRPKFSAIEGDGEGDGKPKGKLRSVDGPGDSAGDEGAEDFMDKAGKQASDEKESLDGFFKGLNEEDRQMRGPGKRVRVAMRKRRNKILLGVLGFLLPIIGGFISLPYQLTHFSSLLQQFHFSINEDTGASRTTRLIRYLKYPNNPENRRLSIVQNKIANRVETKLAQRGFTPRYGNAGYLEGFYFDADNTKFESDLRNEGFDIGEPDADNRRFAAFTDVDGEGRFSSRGRRTGTRTIFKAANYGKTSRIHARVLIRKGGVTFRPLGDLARGSRESLATRIAGMRERREARRRGLDIPPPSTVIDPDADDGTSTQTPEQAEAERQRAAQQATGSDGQKLTTGTDAERISSARNRILGGALAGVAGVGIICTINELDQQADALKWANRALPMMRVGMDLVAAGDQIKNGEGFTAEEVGVWTGEIQEIAQTAVGKDENGQPVFEDIGPWTNAASIRAELGQGGGVDIPDSARVSDRDDFLSKLANRFSFIPSQVCSVATNPIFGAIVTIATLGSATALDFAVDGAILAAGALWLDDLVRIWAGVEVESTPKGATAGNIANHGTRLNANEQAITFGGRELSETETIQVNAVRDQNIAYENSQKSTWDRYFSLDNPRSLASLSVLQAPTGGHLAFAASIFTSPFAAISSLFAPVSAQETYDYGFSRFGFSVTELEDERFQNPYENEEILQSTYDIQELHDAIGIACFGINANEDTSGGSYTYEDSAAYWGDDGLLETCENAKDDNGVSDEVFTRYRFYLLDTMMIASLACYEGFETYCHEFGFNNEGVENVQANNGGIIGNPHDPSAAIACDPRTDDLGVHPSYVGGVQIDARLCALTNATVTGGSESTPGTTYYIDGANNHPIVNSRISGAWYDLIEAAAADGVTITSYSSFRTMAHQQSLFSGNTTAVATPGYSSHQAGTALDVANAGSGVLYGSSCPTESPPTGTDAYDWITGTDAGNGNVDHSGTAAYRWMVENAASFGLLQYSAESWHWDARSDLANRCSFQ